jgi:hypothetical protein
MSNNIVTLLILKFYDSELLWLFCRYVGLIAFELINLCLLSHRKNIIHMLTITMCLGFSQNKLLQSLTNYIGKMINVKNCYY